MAASQPSPVDEKRKRAEREADEKLDELDQAEPEKPDGGSSPFDGTDEVDVDLADVDIGEPVGESPHASPDPEPSAEDPFDGTDDAGGLGEFEDSLGPGDDDLSDVVDEGGPPVGTIINQGAARTAVLGLEDEFVINGATKTKQDLQEEFEEVFETFQLGRFGGECFEKYLELDPDEIEPIWGFTASMFLCTAMVLWMRPDGMEMFNQAAERVKRRNA